MPLAASLPIRLLVVEDDDSVRAVVQRTLAELGHKVTVMLHPEEVLARGAGFIDGFDLLLTDVVMPEMDGPTLARTIGAKNVVFMSGYPGDALDRRGLIFDPERFLEKPFTTAALTDVISRATAESTP